MLRPPTNNGSRTRITVLVNPMVNREQLTQMVFEPLILGDAFRSNCESSSGRATDIALDSDNGVFHMVSIYVGYPLPHIILYLDCVDGYCTDNSTKSRRSSVTASLRLLSARSSATSRSCAPCRDAGLRTGDVEMTTAAASSLLLWNDVSLVRTLLT